MAANQRSGPRRRRRPRLDATNTWRERSASCFQDFVNLELVAQEGVGAGDITHIDDESAVHGALRRAAALDVLERLPDGLFTTVGTTLRGVEFSGGQWQRLAIGRAMMRTEALLTTLDEPTSAIDPLAELALLRQYADSARTLA